MILILALFCSKECRDEHKQKDIDHKPVHHLENEMAGHMTKLQNFPNLFMALRLFLKFHDLFGSTGELRKFVEAHENNSYNLFDFDWSIENPEECLKNMLLMIIGKSEINDKINHSKKLSEPSLSNMRVIFGSQGQRVGPNRFKDIFFTDSPENLKFIEGFIVQLMSASIVSLYYVANLPHHKVATYSHLALKLLRHSCDANIFPHFGTNGEIVWTVNQPIKAGDELTAFSSVGSYYSLQHTGDCKLENCFPCKNRWSKRINLMKLNMDMEMSMMRFFTRHDPAELSSVLKRIGECSDYINTHFDGYYENSNFREKVAAKKEELRKCVNSIACPLPAYGLPLASKYHPLSKEHQEMITHHDTEEEREDSSN